MAGNSSLEYIFHPSSVAIVGASGEIGSMGSMFIKPLLTQGFKGDVYFVHKRKTEIKGLKCYRSIQDIPGPVDHVIIAVPACNTPELMKECVEKQVKVCSIYSAGFSESGTKEGRRLESEIVEIAREGGVRIVGPNSLGIYSPATGMYMTGGLTGRSGHLGIICQSGGNTIYLSRVAEMRGAAVSKAVSYGNACDINESDLLEYFAKDSETRVIVAYIEGVKDGKRFFNALKKAAQAKPTIVLKGGKSETGAITAASHTGSLSGSERVWDSVIRQTGAIPADDLDGLIDMALPFLYMSPPKSRRVGVVGAGGGISVLTADALTCARLSLPELSEEVIKKLSNITPNVGSIYTNPVDTLTPFIDMEKFRDTIRVIAEWQEIDILILHMAYDIVAVDHKIWIDHRIGRNIVEEMIACMKLIDKPAVMVLHYAALPETYQVFSEELYSCKKAGIPVFLSMDRAGRAIAEFVDYHEKLASFSS